MCGVLKVRELFFWDCCIDDFVQSQLEIVGILFGVDLSTSFRFAWWLTIQTSLVSCLLCRCQAIMPSFNIHDSSRWMNNILLASNILLLLGILLSFLFSLISLPLLLMKENRTNTSTFLGWCEVILKQLIHVLLTHNHIQLLILEVWLLSSLLIDLCDEWFDLLMTQSINNCPKEVTFR